MKKLTLQLATAAFLFLISSLTLTAQISFTTSTNNGCAPLSVTLTNTSTNPAVHYIKWSFQDGSPSVFDTVPIVPINHIYTTAGFYSPSMEAYTITNGYLGYTSGGSGNIQVNGTGFNSPDSACVNDMVSFCMNGQGNSYSWNFGDGRHSSNGGGVDHAYPSNGTYTVKLTANSSCGNQSASRLVVIAPSVTPNANAWTFLNTSCPAVPITFNTNGYASYSWNFGDPGSGSNNTSTQQYPSHTYSTIGTYTATVTVTNSCGKTGTASTTVSIVNTPPFPNQSWFKMEVNSSPACPNSNIGFNAPNGYNDYEWNFGDGSPLSTTSNNYNNHTYGSSTGTYTVSVRVISDCGNDTTLHGSVVINNNIFTRKILS